MTERERVEQSNEVAGIVFDQVKLRYGIADALWDAGYRKALDTPNR